MTQLRGAHAVVTGGSSGIGLATAAELAARGASVSLIARGTDRLDAAARQLREAGASVRTATADVSDQASVEGALRRLTEEAGAPDVLVTSAGQARPGHFLELDDEVFRRMMEVDYFGTLYPVRAVAPAMMERGHGSIMVVSSAAGLLGIYGYTAYSPAKSRCAVSSRRCATNCGRAGSTPDVSIRPMWIRRNWPRRTGGSPRRRRRSVAPSSR
ncbi:SDR family NAD(P)-dependent oxidoreductase [Streptomyces peucetius]|uniref:SDR family NAD(P)-dependent oxidoreductase n=1 Tax=Streptomyces peucetius TaxID=1950 RepID=A0ABY6I136_STRPE|nr:SDR family NAD(P)-dependent oxidoreductase [Streptomyces peucetius]UYQ60693.1 SDR family NAD(P)-dependent oxidoreductase [Streptomyces peucetius]